MMLDQIMVLDQSGDLANLSEQDLLAVQGKLDKLIDYMTAEGHEVTDSGVSLTQIRTLEQKVITIIQTPCGCND